MEFTSEMQARLKEPFDLKYMSCRPGGSSDNGATAMVLTYIDARAVQERLDEVFGPGGWNFDWEPAPDFVSPSGTTRLAVKGTITAGGVNRSDVGQACDEEEPYKSAVSDALKRAGVHFGIGRYLYDMPYVAWPLDGKRFRDARTLVSLMCELAKAVYDAGGDSSKLDMRRYKYAGNGGQATQAPPAGQQRQPRPSTQQPKPTAPTGTTAGKDEFACEGCGLVVQGFTSSRGNKVTADWLKDKSVKEFGKPLCRDCQKTAPKLQGSLENRPPQPGDPDYDPFAEE